MMGRQEAAPQLFYDFRLEEWQGAGSLDLLSQPARAVQG